MNFKAIQKESDKRSQTFELDFLPLKLRNRLMSFQKEGICYAIEKNGCCLVADEMGLGKTLQALSVAYYYRHKWPILIVVPASLKYPWVEEVERWFPEIEPGAINMIQNGGDIGGISSSKVTIISYGLLNRPSCRLVQEALMTQEFKFVIVDESHYMKNRRTRTTKYLVPLLQKAEHKILLTGTPSLSRPIELFSQLDALQKGQFGSFWKFSEKYCDGKFVWSGDKKRWFCEGASNLEELQHRLTQDVMIRRLKKDVLTQLPPKQRQKIPFDLKDSHLKSEVDKINQELVAELDKLRLSMSDVLAQKEVDCDSGNPFKVKNLMSKMYTETSKVKIGPVREYVKMLCENRGLKFLVFAYHHCMMDGIAEELYDLNIKYIRIDGQTVGSERPTLVQQFQQDSDTRVAILSIKAAGVGLTLTAANLVVFAELDWTPGSLEQCEDRAHRIGQKETVHCHYLVAKGTLDEYVWAMLSRKTTVVTTTLNGVAQRLNMEEGNETQISRLSNADVYIPPEKTGDISLSQFFVQSQSSSQKSLLDYFTPKGKNGNKGSTATRVKRKRCPSTERCTSQSTDDSIPKIVIVDESPEKRTTKRNKASHKRLLEVEADGNSTDEFKSPVKTVRRAPKLGNIFLDISTTGECDTSDTNVDCTGSIDVNETEATEQERGVTCGDSNDNDIADNGSINKWNCSTCTFLNHEALPYCEMCSSAKPVGKLPNNQGSKELQMETIVSSPNKFDPQTSQSRFKRFSESISTSPTNAPKLTEESKPASPSCDATSATGSIELFSQESQSSTSNYEIESFSDKEVKDATEGLINDSGMEADDETTIMQYSDVESSPTKTNESQLKPEIIKEHPSTPPKDELIQEGSVAASLLFSPGFRKAPEIADKKRTCIECNMTNDAVNDYCEGCLTDKPQYSCFNNESLSTNCDMSKDNNEKWKQCQTDKNGQCSDIEIPTRKCKCKECEWENTEDGSCEMCCSRGTSNEAKSGRRDDAHGDFQREQGTDNSQSNKRSPSNIPAAEESRIVNIDELPVYKQLFFSCSVNTSRVYLYDESHNPLNVNFLPIDVQMDNYGDLPDILLHPQNLKLAKRFVREWHSLSATKRRVVVKSGAIFLNPCLLYQEIRSGKTKSKDRYTCKAVDAASAISKANEIGGSIRVLTRPIYDAVKGIKKTPKSSKGSATNSVGSPPPRREVSEELIRQKQNDMDFLDSIKGTVQALDKDGNPLCIHCHKTYKTNLVSKKTLEDNPWLTRFCSKKCMDEYWMKHHRGYSRQQVFETERGICQQCNFDCQNFFTRIRITKDLARRARLVQESPYGALKPEIKGKMVKKPQMGLFWHADHIVPVALGGGECDLDNLRTLCTVCHRGVTAEQQRNKAAAKRLEAAAFHADITAFFKPS